MPKQKVLVGRERLRGPCTLRVDMARLTITRTFDNNPGRVAYTYQDTSQLTWELMAPVELAQAAHKQPTAPQQEVVGNHQDQLGHIQEGSRAALDHTHHLVARAVDCSRLAWAAHPNLAAGRPTHQKAASRA